MNTNTYLLYKFLELRLAAVRIHISKINLISTQVSYSKPGYFKPQERLLIKKSGCNGNYEFLENVKRVETNFGIDSEGYIECLLLDESYSTYEVTRIHGLIFAMSGIGQGKEGEKAFFEKIFSDQDVFCFLHENLCPAKKLSTARLREVTGCRISARTIDGIKSSCGATNPRTAKAEMQEDDDGC